MEVCVVGSYIQDLKYKLTKFPGCGETVYGKFKTSPGGKGFNQAVACSRQNIKTHFIGAIGSDTFAVNAIEFAQEESNLIPYWHKFQHNTGTAAIMVESNADNRIIVDAGANNFLTQNTIYNQEQIFTNNKISVVLSQFECDLGAVRAAFDLGFRYRAINILNPAPMREFDLSLLEKVNIITPNVCEFQDILKLIFKNSADSIKNCLSEEFMEHGARAIAEYMEPNNPMVIVTLGEKGCFVVENNKSYMVSAFKVNSIDTTGAGDAFAGGLAAGLNIYQNNRKLAVNYANATAALTTTFEGTAPTMPLRSIVSELLKTEEDVHAIY